MSSCPCLPLAADSVTQDLLGDAATSEAIGTWFIRYIVAFLLGGASGGLIFGWLGDRIGRVKAMGASILWYSVWTGVSYFCQTPAQLTALRFVACLGVGGMWPNGVALVSEAWPNVSRPTLAGLIGTSANVGIMLLGYVANLMTVTSENWRWVLIAGSLPIVLALFVFCCVPESPLWKKRGTEKKAGPPVVDVFLPPVLGRTVIGILLGVIPLLGGWGAGKWILPWAGAVGAELGDDRLKPLTQFYWGIGAALGSLCGGWIAHRLGRRLSYFFISLLSVAISAIVFRWLEPSNGLGLPSRQSSSWASSQRPTSAGCRSIFRNSLRLEFEPREPGSPLTLAGSYQQSSFSRQPAWSPRMVETMRRSGPRPVCSTCWESSSFGWHRARVAKSPSSDD